MAKPLRIPGTHRPSVLYVLPSIADDLDAATKNGLAIRNSASVKGRCPDCGATPNLHVDEHGIGHLVFEHEASCGAFTDGAAA